jgi:hypothetical protein
VNAVSESNYLFEDVELEREEAILLKIKNQLLTIKERLRNVRNLTTSIIEIIVSIVALKTNY